MEQMHKMDIEVIILDDNTFYNYLIAEKIRKYALRPEVSWRYKFLIRCFETAGEYLRQSMDVSTGRRATVAFIDEKLAQKDAGRLIVRSLVSSGERLKLIFMVEREHGDNSHFNGGQEEYGSIKIHKHEFTPEICLILVENYIKNL